MAESLREKSVRGVTWSAIERFSLIGVQFVIQLVLAILGEKWLPAVPLMQVLCLAGMLDPMTMVNLNLLYVKGRSEDIPLRHLGRSGRDANQVKESPPQTKLNRNK